MKKSEIIQEIVNVYPSWTKVRTDDQSVGQQMLGAMALPLEKMEKQLAKIKSNQYLTTANLDEIDLVFKVNLDADFSFDEDNTDPLFTCPVTPEVSGLYDSVWYPISQAEFNDIESFWYDSVPNRFSLVNTVSGDHAVTVLDAVDAPVTGVWDHHLDAGRVWVEVTGGVEYLVIDENLIKRGSVRIKGKTRKGLIEEETLIFPWDMKQPTLKEWQQITDINVFDIEDAVEIEVRTADFNGGPYLSQWNLRYSENRNKIDSFWDISSDGTTLDRLEYTSDEWEQLVLGFSDKEVRESWEMLDENMSTISGVDITLQPFSDRAWVVTEDKRLFLYDLRENTVSGIDDTRDSTPGAHIQLDYDFSSVVLGENIEFVPWHARPLKELRSYRIWYQRPDRQKFGLLNGSSVSFTSDFTITISQGTKLTRRVEDFISLPTTMRGEYLIVFEATFVDGTQQEVRRIFEVKYKEPLVELDISTVVSGVPDGIDFDADQKLWVKSGGVYYQIDLHTDIMLIDYTNKILYFKEEFTEVGIDT